MNSKVQHWTIPFKGKFGKQPPLVGKAIKIRMNETPIFSLRYALAFQMIAGMTGWKEVCRQDASFSWHG
jgi:hypothetical protein